MAKENSAPDFWARRPDEGVGERRHDVIRVPAGKSARGIMLAGDITGAYTHWYGGRTTPCLPGKCRACESGVEIRWHGYVPLMALKTNTVQIFEITAAAVEPLDAWYRSHRSLRGALVELFRRGSKLNGMLRSTIVEGPLPPEALPTAPDVKAILRTLWSIKDHNGVLTQERFSPEKVVPFNAADPAQTVMPGTNDLGGRLRTVNGNGSALDHD